MPAVPTVPSTTRPFRRAPLAGRLALAAALAAPTLALAHEGHGAHASGFAAGFAHPFTGLDHLAAMLAVGVWSAMTATNPRRALAAPLAFATLLLAGALLGAAGVALPAVEPMIATSLLALGLLLAARATLPGAAGALLVGGFALFHGAAHGGELAGAGALAGMVLATGALHATGLGLGLALKAPRTAWLARAAGAGVAAFGVALLWPLAA